MATSIVGILNCTPDSFSDRRDGLSHQELVDHAKRLIDDGADILDIGGDSTRPGSTCPGVEEEWKRIAPVLVAMSVRIRCSVDTHHVEVARRAVEHGATIINDISGEPSEEMACLIASSNASYIFMFNAHGGPHLFGEGLTPHTAFSSIQDWIGTTTQHLIKRGIAASKLIADPGMGAFISRDAAVSWEVIKRFRELPAPQGGLLLGCSRKGFLALPEEKHVSERDIRSSKTGATAITQIDASTPTYLRVHNVATQRRILTQWATMSESDRVL